VWLLDHAGTSRGTTTHECGAHRQRRSQSHPIGISKRRRLADADEKDSCCCLFSLLVPIMCMHRPERTSWLPPYIFYPTRQGEKVSRYPSPGGSCVLMKSQHKSYSTVFRKYHQLLAVRAAGNSEWVSGADMGDCGSGAREIATHGTVHAVSQRWIERERVFTLLYRTAPRSSVSNMYCTVQLFLVYKELRPSEYTVLILAWYSTHSLKESLMGPRSNQPVSFASTAAEDVIHDSPSAEQTANGRSYFSNHTPYTAPLTPLPSKNFSICLSWDVLFYRRYALLPTAPAPQHLSTSAPQHLRNARL
jgi:hypothetical protein